MEGKAELFWKQGDFGYVKDVVDSLVVLCKPKSKVWSAVKLVVHQSTQGDRLKLNI